MLPSWYDFMKIIKVITADMEANGEFEQEKKNNDDNVIEAEFVEVKEENLDEGTKLHAKYSSDVEGYQKMVENKQ